MIDKGGLDLINVTQVAYHYYGKLLPDDTLPSLQRSITNHTYLLHGRSGAGVHVMDVYSDYIEQAASHGLPFIFSEVGTDGGVATLGCHNLERRKNMATAL